MATMIKAKSEAEVKITNVSTLRKWYVDLADQYNKIMNEYLKKCPFCGAWKKSDTAYYTDDRFASGRFYFCKQCVLDMVEQKTKPTDPPNETKESVQMVLKLMDIAYIDDLYEKCVKDAQDSVRERNRSSPFAQYITCMKSLPLFRDKKWSMSIFPEESVSDKKPRKKIIDIFGDGFTNDDYLYLQSQYDDFVARTLVDTKSLELYVVQICMQLLDIFKDRKSGKDVTNKLKALDTLMSSANLQPKQNVSNASNDSLTFGQMIEKWEENEPVPEPDEQFRDVDGIGKAIRVWFAGWLGKAIGLNNVYTYECDEEISKYEVNRNDQRVEYLSDDIYSMMFGSDGE